VQLAIGTNNRVHHWVRDCIFDFNGMATTTNLNVLPLGSYIILLGMDLLYIHRTKVDFYGKTFACIYENE